MEEKIKIARELTKKQIIEHIGKAETTAELEAARLKIRNNIKDTTNEAARRLKEQQDVLKRIERDCEQMMAEAVAARHKEIKEANREQWRNDREHMWLEVNRSVTAPALAEILHAALVREIITEYHVTAADGDLMEG